MKEKLPPKTGLDFGAMMDNIDKQEELKQESTNLDNQIDQLRKAIWNLEEDMVTVVQASSDLDDQLNSIIDTSWAVEWTLEDTRDLLEKLQGMTFPVQLDDQSIEAVKGIHSDFFANERKLIEELKQDETQTLAQHRTELKKITNIHGMWLSTKIFFWGVGLFYFFIALFFWIGYFYAKAKFS